MLLSFLAAAVVAYGKPFTCTPTRVWDGDGPIWCAEGPRIRVAGIAAREIDGSCRRYQPCPKVNPIRSRDALARLVGQPMRLSGDGHVLVRGPAMRCVSAGDAKGHRTAAWCVSPVGGDLSCAMVRGGWALPWRVFWRGHRC